MLDVRYALRMMMKAPGLTAALAITLALGIGASTTIFSVVHSVVLSPLRYEAPERLVRVYTRYQGSDRFPVSAVEYDELRRACRSCEAVGAWMHGTIAVAGGERPAQIDAAYASHTLLPMLGVRPMLGRWFDAAEDGRGGDATVIVLGYGVWRTVFGGDAGVIGRKVVVDGLPVTVIGVMPEGFTLPPAFESLSAIEAWLPANFDFDPARRGAHSCLVVARLARGASLGALEAELAVLAAAWSEHRGPEDHHISAADHPMIAVPFQEDLVGSIATSLWILQGAVLLVLLIAIVNIAGLLLARADARMREVAVRHALGASRRRLVRQFVTESLVLGVLGGGLGVLVAAWGVDGVVALIPRSAPRASEIALDGTAVAFAVASTLGAALLFGFAPIVHAHRHDLYSALKGGGAHATASGVRLRARRALVVGELAIAVVLVVACATMTGSLARLHRAELGFAPDHLLTFGIQIPEKTYPGRTAAQFWRRLEDKLRALPGVAGATVLGNGLPPLRPFNGNPFAFAGHEPGPDDKVDYWQFVGTDAFETLGARLSAGRTLRESDTEDAPSAIVINRAFAARFFPGVDPVGRRLHMAPWLAVAREHVIVGVVEDLKTGGVDRPAGTEVFFPIAQTAHLGDRPWYLLGARVVVRTTADPESLVAAVHEAVAALDPALPLSHVHTMDEVLWEAVARPRFLTFLLAAFAGIAVLLAAVGVYGVMAHSVAQRTHEIGLRVALGAAPPAVRKLVLREAIRIGALGIGIGIAAVLAVQLAAGRWLSGVFYGDRLDRPVLLGGVALALGCVAVVAAWRPARRATEIEPIAALKVE